MDILDFLFPKKCISCGRGGRYVCPTCIENVSVSKQLCIVCEKPSIDGVTHIRCRKPLGLDGAMSVWVYEKVVREAIIKLKYKFASEIAGELSFYIANFLKNNTTALPKKVIMTTVPLYKTRKNWRGFNQTYEVGKLLAGSMGWGFADDIVVRNQKTMPQTELKGEERRANVRGAFRFNNSYGSRITGHGLLLIFDDVWTTGTTLKEVCKVLKRNRSGDVWALTIAK